MAEFRADFLIRLCKIDVEVGEQIAEEAENMEPEAIKRLKQEYSAFFQQCFTKGVSMKVASFIESEWAKWEVKSEMLPAKLITDLDKHLGIFEVGSTKNEVEINRVLVDVANNNLYQNDRDVQQRLENEL